MNIQISTVTENGKTKSTIKINGKKYVVDGNVYIEGNNVVDEKGRVIDENYVRKDYFYPEIKEEEVEIVVPEYKPINVEIDPLKHLKNKRNFSILFILWITFLSISLTLLSVYYYSLQQ